MLPVSFISQIAYSPFLSGLLAFSIALHRALDHFWDLAALGPVPGILGHPGRAWLGPSPGLGLHRGAGPGRGAGHLGPGRGRGRTILLGAWDWAWGIPPALSGSPGLGPGAWAPSPPWPGPGPGPFWDLGLGPGTGIGASGVRGQSASAGTTDPGTGPGAGFRPAFRAIAPGWLRILFRQSPIRTGLPPGRSQYCWRRIPPAFGPAGVGSAGRRPGHRAWLGPAPGTGRAFRAPGTGRACVHRAGFSATGHSGLYRPSANRRQALFPAHNVSVSVGVRLASYRLWQVVRLLGWSNGHGMRAWAGAIGVRASPGFSF